MLGFTASAAGAAAGLLIGIALSVYVGLLDLRKRREGIRTRVQYRGSLFLAPALLALLGGLIGLGISRVT